MATNEAATANTRLVMIPGPARNTSSASSQKAVATSNSGSLTSTTSLNVMGVGHMVTFPTSPVAWRRT